MRDTGDSTTLTVKRITSDAIDGTEEIEVGVDDFDTTRALLAALGFTAKAYQESRRASYLLEGAQLEIEAGSVAEVVRVAQVLGFVEADLTGANTTAVYARYGIDLESIDRLGFAASVEQEPPA